MLLWAKMIQSDPKLCTQCEICLYDDEINIYEYLLLCPLSLGYVGFSCPGLFKRQSLGGCNIICYNNIILCISYY